MNVFKAALFCKYNRYDSACFETQLQALLSNLNLPYFLKILR